MIELDKAIFRVLDADRQAGTLAVTGVYVNGDVPEDAAVPFIRFGEMASPASHTMGAGPIEYEAVYQVFAVDDRDADGANGKIRAAAIASRVKTLLHKQPLTVDAPMRHLASLLDRKLDVPAPEGGVNYEQIGANYRIWMEES